MTDVEFSFPAGWPLLSRQAGRTPGGAGLARRAALLALTAWVPLLILAAAGGTATAGRVALSFAADLRVHGRLLLAVPLLIVADLVVGRQLSSIVRHLSDGGLATSNGGTRLEATVQRLCRRRDSRLAEALLLLASFAGSLAIVRALTMTEESSWLAMRGSLTAAGWWYALVAAPLFQFLVYRWIWRGVAWALFLRDLSRLPLALSAAHPDGAGGLGFLVLGQTAYAIVVFALSAVFACAAGERVLQRHEPFGPYRNAMVAFALIAALLPLLPLLAFGRVLAHVKREALLRYGALAAALQQTFESRWLGPNVRGADMLGSADPSSLADLAAEFQSVRKMRIVPVDLPGFLTLLAAAVVPQLPIVLAYVPLKDVVARLLKIVA